MKKFFAFKFLLLAALFMMTTAYTCEFTELTAPCSVNTNISFSVKGRIKNLNETNWNTFPVSFYLSLDRLWSEEDALLGTASVTLSTYEWKDFTANLTIGSEFYSGRYFIIARTPLGNEMCREIEVINPNANLGADLAPSYLFFWGGTNPGENFSFSFTLNNLGLLPASISRVRCYWSLENNVVDASDVMLYQTFVTPSMPGNSRREFTVTNLTIPTNAIPGKVYYLIIKADADSWVSETVEWNNTVSKRIEVPNSFVSTEIEERTEAPVAEDIRHTSFAVSPNPATDYVNIIFQLKAPASVSVEVFDQTGHLVSKMPEQELQPGDYSERIDLQDIPNGIYLMCTIINGEPMTKKVIVQH